MIPNIATQMERAFTGWQNYITGTNASQTGTLVRSDLDSESAGKKLAGTAMAIGTYYYFIPTKGCSSLDVTLRLSTGTAPTITLYPTLADNITLKGTATAVSTVTSTQATTAVTTLKGETGFILKIVAAATFTLDQAEYSAL